MGGWCGMLEGEGEFKRRWQQKGPVERGERVSGSFNHVLLAISRWTVDVAPQ
jgi:hypothetical protein